MDDVIKSVLPGLGGAAPFAALAVWFIKWLMQQIAARDATIASLTQSIITLAQNQERTAAEQTAAIRALGSSH